MDNKSGAMRVVKYKNDTLVYIDDVINWLNNNAKTAREEELFGTEQILLAQAVILKDLK